MSSSKVARYSNGLSKVPPMRFKMTPGINDCQIIEDHSINDLRHLKLTLHFLSQQQNGRKVILILSDLEGDQAENKQTSSSYDQLEKLLEENGVEQLIGVGTKICKRINSFTRINASVYSIAVDLLQSDIHNMFRDAIILLKNASNFQLQQIATALQLKSQRAILEIDHGAIIRNMEYFRSKLNKKTKLLVVLKACSYGTGDFELANILQYQDVDYFAVACTEEGVSFRSHGVTIPILIFNPAVDSFHQIINYQLEPTIYSIFILRRLVEFVTHQKKTVFIHLKLETGMNRHGIQENELNLAVDLFLKKCPYIKVKGIYSHLAGQDSSLHDDYTYYQAVKFIEMAKYIENELEITTIKHLIATGGILRLPVYQYDMVRLGIGLFGVGVDEETAGYLEEAFTFKTVVSQVRKVRKGCTIGYERNGVAKYDMVVAVIDVGYGDGFKRCLGNGAGKVFIGGEVVKIIGNICMDMSMVDVTGMNVRVGDEVIIFGKELSVEKLAKSASTNPQEIYTSISRRVKRDFLLHI